MHDGDLNPRAVMGDNRPPPFDAAIVADLKTKSDEFANAAGVWLDKGALQSEDDAQRLNDFVAGARKLWKKIDDVRKDAKKPHDDAGKAVQAAFTPLLDALKKAGERVQPLATKWMQEQEAKRLKAEREAEEKARKAREEAKRLMDQAAERNDIVGEMEAQAALDDAEKKAKEAARDAKTPVRVASATGGTKAMSLRTYVTAEIENIHKAMLHYKDAPDLVACIKTLAEREARAKGFDPKTDTIPGIALKIEKKAV